VKGEKGGRGGKMLTGITRVAKNRREEQLRRSSVSRVMKYFSLRSVGERPEIQA